MATTFVEPAREIKPDLNPTELLNNVHEMLERAQGDEDKAGDVEDCVYYEGWKDALTWIQNLMTVPEPENGDPT
jgi:hypothetical protein